MTLFRTFPTCAGRLRPGTGEFCRNQPGGKAGDTAGAFVYLGAGGFPVQKEEKGYCGTAGDADGAGTRGEYRQCPD